MNHEDLPLEKIYLKPGELMVAEEPVMVTTVLGSCVSVTMFHPETGAAAICHAMLPHGGTATALSMSMPQCIIWSDISGMEIPRKEIQVKLFGGADMFNSVGAGRRTLRRMAEYLSCNRAWRSTGWFRRPLTSAAGRGES